MNDSADMKSAEAELDRAVDSLEVSIDALLSRMRKLETGAQDSDAFRQDRVKLAAQLDEMAADAQAAKDRLAAREAEFTKLTQDSEAELDRVMTVVRGALQNASGG
jgi:uncharacterized protein involved in exopolysaccharide biosynthesis